VKTDDAANFVEPDRAASATSSIRVGIIGHVGNENLGDESIIAAVIQNVRRRCPDAEIFGFTIVPSDTEARHGIPSFPIRRLSQSNWTAASPSGASSPGSARNRSAVQRAKDLIKIIPFLGALMGRTQRALESIPKIIKEILFLRQSREHVKDLDLLIFAGSHQLNDFVGGPWSFPYTVLKWTLLAKGAGARVVFLSLGAGPIDSWLGRSFILRALKNASYRSYRDVTAKRVIDGLHLFPADKVVPDLAFSLDSPVALNEASSVGRLVVGINPMPLYTDYWHETDFGKYQNYVGKLASFADGLVDRGYEVHFIPTQLRVDPPVITEVRKQMSRNGEGSYKDFIVEPATQTLDQLRSALGNVDIMVATRYHGILLSLALEKPVLAVAYHSKSRDLMEWLGLGEYVIDGDGFTPVALAEMISSLERNRDVVTASLREQLPGFRSAVQAQYDQVLGLVARGGGVR
jgi:polysaccharide pyruvyl transferase WcaK-like protein